MQSLPVELQTEICNMLGYSEYIKLKLLISKGYYKYFFVTFIVVEQDLFMYSLMSSINPFRLVLEFIKNGIDKFKHDRSELFNPFITGDNYYDDLLINKDNDVHTKLINNLVQVGWKCEYPDSNDSVHSNVAVLEYIEYSMLCLSQVMIDRIVADMTMSDYFVYMTGFTFLLNRPNSIYRRMSLREIQKKIRIKPEFLTYCLRESMKNIYNITDVMENIGLSQTRYIANYNLCYNFHHLL
jgi:hypothetical protein